MAAEIPGLGIQAGSLACLKSARDSCSCDDEAMLDMQGTLCLGGGLQNTQTQSSAGGGLQPGSGLSHGQVAGIVVVRTRPFQALQSSSQIKEPGKESALLPEGLAQPHP